MKKNYFSIVNNIPLFLKSSKAIHLPALKILASLFLLFSSLTATYAQSCNVVKNGTFDSNISDWTSSPSGTGWFSYSGQAYIDKDGITAPGISLKQPLTGLIRNSTNTLTISFKIKGQNADRLMCSTSATLEVRIGGVTYMRINNPLNNATITNNDILVYNGATYTPSPTGFSIIVGGAGTGPNGTKPGIAETALTQNTITLTIPWTPTTAPATNADLEFVALLSSSTLAGTGTCVGTSGGDDWYLDDISVFATNPTKFDVIGTNGCAGTSTTIGLNGSQIGVNYQLQQNGANVGIVVAGNGSAITFAGTYSTAGAYTVIATAGTTSCTTTMTPFVINPTPTVANAGPDQSTCGLTSVTLGGNTPTVGTGLWSIVSGNGGTVTTPSSPTSTFTGTAGTTYTLRWTISNSPCPASTDDVIIKFNQNPIVSITGNTYICSGFTTTLSPTTGGTWISSNPSVATVTNAGVVTGIASGSATFTFTNTTTGCSATTAVVTVSPALSTVFNTSGSFTVPAGVTSLQVESWGAGGGGSNRSGAAGGGGGGAYTRGILTSLTPGNNLNIIVGTGGAAGENGGNSSVGTIVANGGLSVNSTTDRTGGAGGIASAVTGNVIVSYSGYNGGNARVSTSGVNNEAGGGGGGSATTTGSGGSNGADGGSSPTNATIGGTGTGNGGVGAAADGNPDAVVGNAPGGGGGGRGEGSSTSKSGANGRVVITILAPTATAGGNQSICPMGTATVSGASVSNGTILWTHNGAGSLTNATTLTPTYTAAAGDTGNTVTLTMTVSNGPCVTPATATYTVIVLPTITLTPNKVDETCPASNNGSISPVLSGGLTNVRYIRLTQKYVNADAWQQVAEIQAFEVFTGVNVALQSNGASAASSTNYDSNSGPEKAIDGNVQTIWHSGTPNINEYIIVDLSSAKNLDRLRIYNRPDYYGFRGQNMLLELLGDSNNILFAKNIDLRGATGIENFVEVNVLDVSWSDGATTLNRTGLDSGTYTLNYSDGVGCSLSMPVNITSRNTAPAAPTAVVTAQPNCSELTGTITLSGLPSSGTINQTINGLTTSFAISQIGGEQIISGLAAGSYTFTVTQGSCTSTPSTSVTINAFSRATVIWNGVSFTTTPTIEDRVEFRGSYTSGVNNAPTDVDACSCYIDDNSAVVVFKKGHTLNVINEVQVLRGSLTFESEASLVQHKDVPFKPNSGSITYERKTTITRYDYTYWSSPVEGRTLKQLSPFTLFDRYFSYDPVAATPGWQLSKSGVDTMIAGHGYIVRGPQNSSITTPAEFPGIFIGKPHSGIYNGNDLAVVADKDYLLGNPYPSAIDADKFLTLNSTRLQGTLYFWTHNSEPVAAQGTTTYKYNSSDYASYNKTGGTGTGGVIAGTGGKIPTGKIGAGQGFFARAVGTGNVLFNNSMRLAATQTAYLDNSQFFKLDTGKNAVAAVTTTEKNRVWLNLTNTEGAFKQILVGYVTGATNEYDNGFDGVTYNGNSFVDFYSVNQDKNLVIQGRALPFVKKDSIALGYTTTIKGDFKISIDQVDGIFTTQNVLLEDKELKVQHDLKKEAYTFSTEKGTFNNRFVLRYVDKNAIEIIEPEIPVGSDTAVVVSVQNGEITISSPIALIDKVIVYDVAGRKRYQNMKVANKSLIVKNILSSHQVLVVKTTLENGETVTSKIVY